MSNKNRLLDKILDKSASVCVVGLGYVGLPLALEVRKVGFRVIGFDINLATVSSLKKGKSILPHISTKYTREEILSIEYTSDLKVIEEPIDIFLICVPTPLDGLNNPDLSLLRSAVLSVLATAQEGCLIVLESSTYPYTTKQEIVARLPAELVPDESVFIGYSPEREDPGNVHYSTTSIPKVVSGYGPESLHVASTFYSSFIHEVFEAKSLEVAEAAKLLENSFRFVNIQFISELRRIFSRAGIDIFDVVQAAASKPFGFMPFYPSIGVGGHCIPVDPVYLQDFALRLGSGSSFIEACVRERSLNSEWVYDKIKSKLDAKSDARLLFLGVTYKANISDCRESAALALLRRLFEEYGERVSYCDPYVKQVDCSVGTFVSLSDDIGAISGFDIAVFAVAHREFLVNEVLNVADIILDGCGALDPSNNVKRF